MSKIAVVYWSWHGQHFEAMANGVLSGAKAAGAQAELFTALRIRSGEVGSV